MNFLELSDRRYSVRNFSDKKISESDLNKILEAGRIAPTAVNFQPQKIYVLKSDSALSKIRKSTRMAYNAPVVLLVCYDELLSWKNKKDPGYDAGEMDCSIVTSMMMMQAAECNIDTLWARGYETQKIISAFGLPENIKPVCLLLLGYADNSQEPDFSRHHSRKAIEETVTVL